MLRFCNPLYYRVKLHKCCPSLPMGTYDDTGLRGFWESVLLTTHYVILELTQVWEPLPCPATGHQGCHHCHSLRHCEGMALPPTLSPAVGIFKLCNFCQSNSMKNGLALFWFAFPYFWVRLNNSSCVFWSLVIILLPLPVWVLFPEFIRLFVIYMGAHCKLKKWVLVHLCSKYFFSCLLFLWTGSWVLFLACLFVCFLAIKKVFVLSCSHVVKF